jgi:epoxyqueuosine reductase QueG
MHTTSVDSPAVSNAGVLDAGWLRQVCLDSGADDVGFVELERASLADERPHIERAFPCTRTLVSVVLRMNRENVRSPARSVANAEFHHAGDEVNLVIRRIATRLEREGIRAMNPPMAFPMEADRWMTERMWLVSHKPIAVAAGMGRMGIHRNVIHPRFGNFILLGTILVGAEVSETSREIDYNPCFECKLCVAACPVGAIGADGSFNAASCLTHNYHEFMGGFSGWIETIADSRNGKAYREVVKDSETVSMWQSLAYGPNYKAAYCMAVCPAGDDVIGPYRQSKKEFTAEILRPLQNKPEDLYVIRGSDAETYARKRYPNKSLRYVSGGLRPRNLKSFLQGIQISFQRRAARDLNATYHFIFTGHESATATIVIGNGTLEVQEGLRGEPNIRVTADTATWLGFLAKEKSLPWALLTRRIKLRGNPKWLLAFGRCFAG